MAKLFFYYSAMNAGKTTTLLQSAYNYHERGMRTLIFTPKLDFRAGEGMVASRIGLKAKALVFERDDDLETLFALGRDEVQAMRDHLRSLDDALTAARAALNERKQDLLRHQQDLPETPADDLRTRIRKTIDYLQSVPAAQIDGSEGREIVITLRSGDVKFDGQRYLEHWALPNFYFHLMTAYALLRQAGVDLGKQDYLKG